jgi:hypothetical protein
VAPVSVAGGCSATLTARSTIAATDGGSPAMGEVPASEAAGPGPIAAPTTMPMPSIAAVSAALARREGSLGRLGLGNCGLSIEIIYQLMLIELIEIMIA